ncbi:oxidoreductase [Thalassotalea insulae]|uniref:Oxidoreductase n=1 Tax=Thalassotalea insulae TaxID=2056778 RepID=A0ABQ6GMX7_9GAMM|nr:molybdopterin cofactor-binding domain-containing protein [Thalassotalea insulae]GLX77231.1 oxidoreductase [Thalassotalea insulae]
MQNTMSRRQFIKISLATTTVTTLNFSALSFASSGNDSVLSPFPFLSINADGQVIYYTPRADMGQGSATGLRLIVADELGINADKLIIKRKNPQEGHWVGTGGSSGTYSVYRWHRQRIATVRQLLINAAAKVWSVSAKDCRVEDGTVIHSASQQRTSFGDLVALAKTLELPEKEVQVMDVKDFKWIGQSRQLEHIEDIVSGRATYSIDVELKDMVYASIERCPFAHGELISYDEQQVKAMAGVVAVIALQGSGWQGSAQYRPCGVAVIANSHWAAQQARAKLNVKWSEPATDIFDDKDIERYLAEKAEKNGVLAKASGDVALPLNKADKQLQAHYKVPFWTHAPMEPMNATADVVDGHCEVWSGCHLQTILQNELAELIGLPNQQIRIHTPLIGGSFGRRLYRDYAIEAVLLSKQLKRPVQVLFDRADDMRFGHFMPAGHFKVRSAIQGHDITSLELRAVQQSNETQRVPDKLKDGKDELLVKDPQRYPYEIPNIRYEQHYTPELSIPTGYWRGTYSNSYAFVFESWIDELAFALKKDPLKLRLSLLSDSQLYPKIGNDVEQLDKALARRVLTRVADIGQWSSDKDPGQGRGIAWCFSFFYSYAAAVVDLNVSEKNNISIEKVSVTVDCGVAINPNMIKAQIEGGVVWALSALKSSIHFKEGRVTNTNFHDYPVLTYQECPAIVVEIMESDRPSAGVGELGNMPIFAAVCNAIFDATGERIRELPLTNYFMQST